MSDTSDSRRTDTRRDREEFPPRARAQRPTGTERSRDERPAAPRRLSPADVLYGTDREDRDVPAALAAALPPRVPTGSYDEPYFGDPEYTERPLYGGRLSDRDESDSRRSSGRPASAGSAYASAYVPPVFSGATGEYDEGPASRPVERLADDQAFLQVCKLIRDNDRYAAELLDNPDPRPLLDRLNWVISRHPGDPRFAQAARYLSEFRVNPTAYLDLTQRIEPVPAAPLMAPSRVAPAASAGNFQGRLPANDGGQQPLDIPKIVLGLKRFAIVIVSIVIPWIVWGMVNGSVHFNQWFAHDKANPGTKGGWISALMLLIVFIGIGGLWLLRRILNYFFLGSFKQHRAEFARAMQQGADRARDNSLRRGSNYPYDRYQ